MTDENKEEENSSDSSTKTPRPPHSSSNKPFDPKKMDEEIRKATENAIPRARTNAPGWSYAPGKGPHTTKSTSTNPTFIQKNKKTIEWGIVLGAIAIVIGLFSIPGFYDTIFPPEPEINVTDLNTKGGIIEGNKLVYSYEPTSFTPNGTKNEVFSLKISNTGDANAHNFWIDVDSKPDGLWFDFQSSGIIEGGIPKDCQQKSSYCTIALIPKESNSIIVEYEVEFDHKLYQEINEETPKLFFTYNFDEGDEQKIEVFLKFN